MKKIKNDKYLDKLVLEHDIIRYLKDNGIEFKFIKYEKGEIIIKMDEVINLFQFIVKGNIEIYGVKQDGSMYPKYKEFLMNDNYFLRFVLKSISEKMTAVSSTYSKYNTFEEKLIYYMKEECEDNMITSVENTRFQLSCSRRQIQRVLRKLVDENKIVKMGKGCYRLNINNK